MRVLSESLTLFKMSSSGSLLVEDFGGSGVGGFSELDEDGGVGGFVPRGSKLP